MARPGSVGNENSVQSLFPHKEQQEALPEPQKGEFSRFQVSRAPVRKKQMPSPKPVDSSGKRLDAYKVSPALTHVAGDPCEDVMVHHDTQSQASDHLPVDRWKKQPVWKQLNKKLKGSSQPVGHKQSEAFLHHLSTRNFSNHKEINTAMLFAGNAFQEGKLSKEQLQNTLNLLTECYKDIKSQELFDYIMREAEAPSGNTRKLHPFVALTDTMTHLEMGDSELILPVRDTRFIIPTEGLLQMGIDPDSLPDPVSLAYDIKARVVNSVREAWQAAAPDRHNPVTLDTVCKDIRECLYDFIQSQLRELDARQDHWLLKDVPPKMMNRLYTIEGKAVARLEGMVRHIQTGFPKNDWSGISRYLAGQGIDVLNRYQQEKLTFFQQQVVEQVDQTLSQLETEQISGRLEEMSSEELLIHKQQLSHLMQCCNSYPGNWQQDNNRMATLQAFQGVLTTLINERQVLEQADQFIRSFDDRFNSGKQTGINTDELLGSRSSLYALQENLRQLNNIDPDMIANRKRILNDIDEQIGELLDDGATFV
ncbi:hypothetical protein CI610_01281 [invertebrate metagenome]|uniref:Uncharacterized protein n=1 Tax=invertebrate metagenome TaxID=1711999 RepID=A0A2H9T909_9ZZZZ